MENTFSLTSTEDFTATIAPGGEFFIVTTSTVDTIGFRTELLVDQAFVANGAQKASFMPVLIFI